MINSDPRLSQYMSLENTLVIDDRKSTFSANPGNGIKIPLYSPPETINGIESDDIALKQFMFWLLRSEVINTKDVRTLDKSRIFKTPLPQLQNDAGLA